MIRVETTTGELVEGMPVWSEDTKALMESVQHALWDVVYYPGLEDVEGGAETIEVLDRFDMWVKANFRLPNGGTTENR
jgi:hypothetical protein